MKCKCGRDGDVELMLEYGKNGFKAKITVWPCNEHKEEVCRIIMKGLKGASIIETPLVSITASKDE